MIFMKTTRKIILGVRRIALYILWYSVDLKERTSSYLGNTDVELFQAARVRLRKPVLYYYIILYYKEYTVCVYKISVF